MEAVAALKMLTEEMHSAAVATIGDGGRPQIRIIDMMLCDESGVYFLTAKGKEFYFQLMQQKYVAISAVKGKKSLSLRGWVRCIGQQKLEEIFEKNAYMQQIYPQGTRSALQVFCLYKAEGEYFDISNPSCVVRDSFFIGDVVHTVKSYVIGSSCTGCKSCYNVCPQKCIDVSSVPAVINQNNCLHCGNCKTACPYGAVTLQDMIV
ncbi:MAG: 4Fe-4S binding protein [Clostridia bacterium]|nr:4Fe-4S binding protein [Clostridia bacterium]